MILVFKKTSALAVILAAALWDVVSAADSEPPPPFFLQDPKDSLCLAGETFKRCSVETLFFVTGSPGSYQLHKYGEEKDEACLAKKSCNFVEKQELLRLAKCSHCGAQEWNILGDADTGYVLTVAEKTCVVRDEDNMAYTVSCESETVSYTPLQLRFASAADIDTMSSSAARLVGAAADGDKKRVQALLKAGTNVNVRDWDGLTALIPAASAGHLEICKFLLSQDIDVNAADKDGITALMEASIMGHSKVVDFLLEKGAEVDAAAGSEVTALWLAASEGKLDCIKSLLAKGATASNTRSDGITALMTAAVGGHTDTVRLLLESEADPVAVDGSGLTALMNAAENGTVAVLELLTSATPENTDYLNTLSSTGFTALIIAAAHGHTEAVNHLLSAGADPEACDTDSGVNALMYASASNHADTLGALFDHGDINLEARHSNGGTAILEAATSGSPEALEVLIEKGAQVDILDSDGVSPLMAIASNGNFAGQQAIVEALKRKFSNQELVEHINLFSHSGGSSVMFATAGGHLENTKHLIDLGADIHAIARATPEYLKKLAKMIEDGTYQEEEPHIDGVTALHVAAQGGHLTVVEHLVGIPVDVTVADDEGRTPLFLAVKGNHGEVASSLVKAGADPNTPYEDDDGMSHNLLFDAIMVENVDFAMLLIEHGADLYHTDEKKVSTLLQASHRGLSNVVKMLLEKHGDKDGYINDASDEGISPLLAAASEGHDDVVKLLISAKVNTNIKDLDGTSALMAAAARGQLESVKSLLEAGASVNEQNADGHNALMFAYNGKNQVDTLWERYNQYVGEAENDAKRGVDDNGTGDLIREALDKHMALVDVLLKNGADASMKDKEGHTAKDFDFHPDADAEILDKEAKAEKIRDQSKYEL